MLIKHKDSKITIDTNNISEYGDIIQYTKVKYIRPYFSPDFLPLPEIYSFKLPKDFKLLDDFELPLTIFEEYEIKLLLDSVYLNDSITSRQRESLMDKLKNIKEDINNHFKL